MNTPNPFPQDEAGCDELDRLGRRALQALVGQQEPPERVWKSIRLELERDEAPPRRFQMPWLPLVLQPALTLLILVMGGITLRALLHPENIRRLPSANSPAVAMVYVEEGPAFSDLGMLQDKDELRSLKTLSKPTPAHPAQAELVFEPSLVVPRDPNPNVLSPEGRAPLAESSRQRPTVEDRQSLHSGPYQWPR